jgi:hypothetical protein
MEGACQAGDEQLAGESQGATLVLEIAFPDGAGMLEKQRAPQCRFSQLSGLDWES